MAGDVYRPAAIDQLITLGKKIEASGRDEILAKGQAEAATRESVTARGVSSCLQERPIELRYAALWLVVCVHMRSHVCVAIGALLSLSSDFFAYGGFNTT